MTLRVRLSALDETSRPLAATVAMRGDRAITWSELTSDVGHLAGALAEHGTGRWLLYAADTYRFAVGLLALWQSGSIAVVPPHAQAGTLAELAGTTRGSVTDHAGDHLTGASQPVLVPGRARPRERWSWRRLDERAPRLELCTSGTTGLPKTVAKGLGHLAEEIDGLEQQWGSLVEDREVFATVSHHHIYGLLFRLLWPLCAGRPFRAETHLHADELVPHMLDAERGTLVTAPVHLRRLLASDDFRKLGATCHPIFSSGGPLDESSADALIEAFGDSALEVFGSTETGGVAWRQQRATRHRLAWTLFPTVAGRTGGPDDRLTVESPFVSAPGPESRLLMEDRARFLADGRFLLLGRADRTVKVGEKRIDLAQMEAHVRAHRYIQDAALVLLRRPPEPRIGAAVVLNDQGRAVLATDGRRAITGTLTRHLCPHWDPVALPRAWRYLDGVPRDPQGKVSAEALRCLFEPGFDRAVTFPEILEESRGATSCERTLRVPETLAFFEGHFPALPIVPAVVQIAWVADALQALIGRPPALTSLEALKFTEMVRPGQALRLRVDSVPGLDRFHFRLWSSGVVFASGRGRIGSPRTAP